MDAEASPWFARGDTAWSLLVQLDETGVEQYLRDRHNRGFNLILVNAIEKKYSSRAPANAEGEPPFTGEPFRSEPNEAYWQFVDKTLSLAEDLGISVLICPAYLGKAADEGWASDVVAASNDDLRRYGEFLSDRYGALPNVMWLIGHDRVPDAVEKTRMEALAASLPADDLVGLGANPSANVLGTQPWQPTAINADFETVYSYAETPIRETRTAWEESPARPVLFLEGHYEQEGVGDAVLRHQTYGSFVSGASGALFGNNPLWHFDSGRELFPFFGTWQQNLGSPGSADSEVAWGLITSLPWDEMVPDIRGELVTQGRGDGPAEAGARFSHTDALVYVPTSRPVSLDLQAMDARTSLVVERVDPRSGERACVGGFSPSSTVQLPVPSDNSGEAEDWVYLVHPGTGC